MKPARLFCRRDIRFVAFVGLKVTLQRDEIVCTCQRLALMIKSPA